jgi:hypothetical protein
VRGASARVEAVARTFLWCAAAWSVAARPAVAADVLYQSAEFTGMGQEFGFALGADQYLGVRFENTALWRVESVGAHAFQGSPVVDGLFVALVPLEGPDDLPGSADLREAVWHATFEAPLLSNDVLVPCGLLLEPGWWGLVFGGGGLFGSRGSGGLAAYQSDVGDPSYFRYLGGRWEESGSPGKRMFLEGQVACEEDTADTATQCAEDCGDTIDNDVDGWIDCQDEDCWFLATCCDADGDGFARADEVCGWGPDCDDHPETGPAFRPGAGEAVGDGIDQDCDGVDTCYADADGDGFGSPIRLVLSDNLVCGDAAGEGISADDCDDVGPGAELVFPGAVELAGDEVDSDCDGRELCFVDVDGDGWGGATVAMAPDLDCLRWPGLTSLGGDCVDDGHGAAGLHPGAPDFPADGVDQDCDGVDACYVDADRDGWGGAATAPGLSMVCTDGGGLAPRTGDCADVGPGAAAVNPDAAEVVADGVDQDCDGLDACWIDSDGDGFGGERWTPWPAGLCGSTPGMSPWAGDCLDHGPDAATVSPAAVEVPGDGVDQDCNGVDDCFLDLDGDGFGGPVVVRGSAPTCDQSDLEVSASDDCLDVGAGAAEVHPGALDVPADGVDQDCDGDDACWRDADGDGWGGGVVIAAGGVCGDAVGEATVDGDCRDDLRDVHPERAEVIDDGVDQDCDGGDGCWLDADGDGFGAAMVVSSSIGCGPDPMATAVPGDCDDAAPEVFPGASDPPYDGVDGDCVGGDVVDLDGDGVASRALPGGTDCNDLDPSVGPGRPEVLNGRDDNCDGRVDEGTSAFDDDGDGVAEDGGDCDDADPRRSPRRVERCDGVDEDCDGLVDEGTSCYDDDGDGLSEAQGDCHDGDRRRYPGAVDLGDDGIDNDCDGVVVGELLDPDGDGRSVAAGDCAPQDLSIHPGAAELADGVDQDCDGVIDEGTRWYDDDGDGLSEAQGDCDDTNPAIRPSAEEIDNGVDDDCDGGIDQSKREIDGDRDGVPEVFDCDDRDPRRRPGRREVRNGVDDDCNGVVDDVEDEDRDGCGSLPEHASSGLDGVGWAA